MVSEVLPDGVLLETSAGIEFVGATELIGFSVDREVTGAEAVVVTPRSAAAGAPASAAPDPPPIERAMTTPASGEAEPARETANEPLLALMRSQAGIAPAFGLPEPDFDAAGLTEDDRNSLVRALNRYHYALKVKEPGRVLQDVGPLAIAGESTSNPKLVILAGRLAVMAGDVARGTQLFATAYAMGSDDAHAALAATLIAQRAHESLVELLVTVIADGRAPSDSARFLDLVCQLRRAVELVSADDRNWCRQQLEAHVTDLSTQQVAVAHVFLQSIDPGLGVSPPAAVSPPAVQPASTGNEPPEVGMATQSRSALVTALTGEQVGRVVQYNAHGRWGLVQARDSGTSFRFRLDDIDDDALVRALKSGVIGHEVDFRRHTTITPGQLGTASIVGVRVLRSLPPVVTPPPPARRPTGQRETHLFKRGKQAEDAGNFEQAAEYYIAEIEEGGPRKEAAIKDLAWMYNRMKEYDKAIAVLDRYDKAFSTAARRSADNMRLTILQHAGRSLPALDVIDRLRSGATPQQLNTLDQQHVIFLVELERVEEAKAVIERLRARSTIAPEVLDRLSQLVTTEPSNEEERRTLVTEIERFGLGLSPLAEFWLGRADNFGVDERSKRRGYLDSGDFKNVENQLDSIKGRRPDARSPLQLTLANICYREPQAAGDQQLAVLLQRYFKSMAEMGYYGQEPTDSTRSYAIEAIRLMGGEYPRTELAILLSTYAPEQRTLDNVRDETVIELLTGLYAATTEWSRFAAHAPHYFSCAPKGFQHILRIADRVSEPCARDLSELASREPDETRRLRTERATLEQLQASAATSSDQLEAMRERLEGVASTSVFDLDRHRIDALREVLEQTTRFWRERAFHERENAFRRATGGLQTLLGEIKAAPTAASVLLIKFVTQVSDVLMQSYDAFQSEAKPSLDIQNVLADDRQTLEADQSIRLALEITSEEGSAPVEHLELDVAQEDGLRVKRVDNLEGVFRGGERREIQLFVLPSINQVADRAFTVRCALKYRRGADVGRTEEFLLSVNIDDQPFTAIEPNPYEPYSGGKPVDDPRMFFGRGELVDRIIRQTTVGSLGQCFVLYGQKRSGKSSILGQVERRLDLPFIPVRVSLGTVDTVDAHASFVGWCIEEMEDFLDDRSVGAPGGWPTYDETKSDPIRSLSRAIELTRHALGLGDAGRVILLVDEFTYLFEYIREGVVEKTFMRQWKAMLERRMFSAVVVGQDSMPRFKAEFPNEFGVVHDERLTYLSESDACALASDPIHLDGVSRFKGGSMNRLLELTAGSPYYLQILCDELVRQLNARKANFITEADVKDALDNLISGQRLLGKDKFDPLITAAGESVATAPQDDYFELLARVASMSEPRIGVRAADLRTISVPQLDFLVDDLVEREVLTRDGPRLRIKVGLFEEWLRVNRPAVEETAPATSLALR